MSRFSLINPEPGRARELLDAVKYKLGLVPNTARAMVNAPVALDGYFQLDGALARGLLSAKVCEQIALAVSQANGCNCCLAAHSAVGKMVGLTAEQIQYSRGGAIDPTADALTGPSPRSSRTSRSTSSPTTSTSSPRRTSTSRGLRY